MARRMRSHARRLVRLLPGAALVVLGFASTPVRANNPPYVPQVLQPFADATKPLATPTFEFGASDPDSLDVIYELQLAPRGDFSNPTVSLITDPYPQGQSITVTLTATQALQDGVVYGWRVRAKDPSTSQPGSDLFGVWSPTYFYRYDSSLERSAFLELIGPQFAAGALSQTRADRAGDYVELGPLPAAFADDFEVDLSQWISTVVSPASATIVAGAGRDATAGLVIDDSGDVAGSAVLISPAISVLGRLYAEVWLAAEGDGPLFAITMDDGMSLPTRVAAVGISNGYIVAPQGAGTSSYTNLVPYTYGTWVHLALEHDLNTGTFDVFVDGARVLSGAAQLATNVTGQGRRLLLTNAGFGSRLTSSVPHFDDVMAAGVATSGTFCTVPVELNRADIGANGWNRLSWESHVVGQGSVRARLQDCTATPCVDIPPTVFNGNDAGFAASPVDLSGLDASIYDTVRACFDLTALLPTDDARLLMARIDLLPSTGVCAGVSNTTACDDGDFCTVDTKCMAGLCTGGGWLSCDDGNVCTDDACDSNAATCLNTYNTASCDDGLACTSGDACVEGSCVPQTSTCAPPDRLTIVAAADAPSAGGEIAVDIQAVDIDGSPWVGALDFCLRASAPVGDLALRWVRPDVLTSSRSVAGGLEVCGTTDAGGRARLVLSTTAAQEVALSLVRSPDVGPTIFDDATTIRFVPGAAAAVRAVPEQESIAACSTARVRLEVVDTFGNRLSGASLQNIPTLSLTLSTSAGSALMTETTLGQATALPAASLDGTFDLDGVAEVAFAADATSHLTLAWTAPSLTVAQGSLGLDVGSAALDVASSSFRAPAEPLVAGTPLTIELALVDSCGRAARAPTGLSVTSDVGAVDTPVATGETGVFAVQLVTPEAACPGPVQVSAVVAGVPLSSELTVEASCAAPHVRPLPSGCQATPSASVAGLVALLALWRRRPRRQRAK